MQSSIQVPWRVVWVGFCMLVLLGCTRAAPEQRLRATLEQMHQAIEARQIGDAMALVAEDFVGENGLDAAGLRRLMQVQMLGNQQVGVTMGPVDVVLRGDTATVRFTALLTGGSGRSLPVGDCRAATGSCITRNGCRQRVERADAVGCGWLLVMAGRTVPVHGWGASAFGRSAGRPVMPVHGAEVAGGSSGWPPLAG